MSSKITSVHGYTCAQIYGTKFGYIKAYPMDINDKQNLADSLSLIILDADDMHKLHTDNAPKTVVKKTHFFKCGSKEGIYLTTIYPNFPEEKYVNNIVGKAKIGAIKIMVIKLFPLLLL